MWLNATFRVQSGGETRRCLSLGRGDIAAVGDDTDVGIMTSEQSKAEANLRALLARYASPDTKRAPLLEADVRLLAESLVASQPRSVHSLAYLVTSKIISDPTARGAVRDASVAYLESTFLHDQADVEPVKLVPFTSLAAALFPLDPTSAKELVEHRLSISTDDKAVDDPLAVLLEAAELPSPLQLALADMLAQAAGTKVGRELVRSRAAEWLQGALDLNENPSLAAVCAVALSKLGQEVVPGQEGIEEPDVMGLCDKMVFALMARAGEGSTVATMTSIEGLAILSSRSPVKLRLASDPSLLKALIDLCPVPRVKGGSLPDTPRASMDLPMDYVPVDTGLCYGITTILVNLTSPKPILSAEDEQVAKLRAMAISGKRSTANVTQDDPADQPESVRGRVRAVHGAGGVGALTGLVRAESRAVKEGLAKLCLNLVENKEDRLAFVRDGGFRVLSTVIRDLAPKITAASKAAAKPDAATTKPADNRSFLYAAQALAKLVITTPPNLLFPPPLTTTCLDALKPLYHCLSDPSSTLLQQFESLMALTNLASIEPSIASRIIDASITPEQDPSGMWRGTGRDDKVRVLHKVEECLISDNTLVRRAATELICNLVSSQLGFEEFTTEQSGRTGSRLRLLLILSNSDDLPTRLATGGALAILTESPHACSCLLSEGEGRSVWTRVLGMFVPHDTDEEGESIPVVSSDGPDEASLHRAAVILHNLVVYSAGLEDEEERKRQFKRLRQDDVETTLMSLLTKSIDRDVLEPVVECLKVIKQHPV